MPCVKRRVHGENMTSVPGVYHEQQRKQLCAMHSLNNFLQYPAFTQQELDTVCEKLSPDKWINPHKSMLGLGNYDINVLIATMQSKGFEVVWFDKRRSALDLCAARVSGFVLNISADVKLGPMKLPLNRQHWFCVRSVNDVYYNLDSKLPGPVVVGNRLQLLDFLKVQLTRHKDSELMLLLKPEVAEARDWMHRSSTNRDVNATEHELGNAVSDTAAEQVTSDELGNAVSDTAAEQPSAEAEACQNFCLLCEQLDLESDQPSEST